MQAIYQSRRVPNNLLIVGTFSEALVKLATPPFPPQTKLNSEQNRWKQVLFWPQNSGGVWGDEGMNPKPIKILSLGVGTYVTITWEGVFTQSPSSFDLHCRYLYVLWWKTNPGQHFHSATFWSCLDSDEWFVCVIMNLRVAWEIGRSFSLK